MLTSLGILKAERIKKCKCRREDLAFHTGAKIHISSKNSHVQNHMIQEICIFKIIILFKLTFSKSHFQQESYFQNRIFHTNHISKAIFHTNRIFIFFLQKLHFSQ